VTAFGIRETALREAEAATIAAGARIAVERDGLGAQTAAAAAAEAGEVIENRHLTEIESTNRVCVSEHA
jgi:hypothetical protein